MSVHAALKPGGYIFGRFAADPEDDDRPQHIVHDFQPVFDRLAELGIGLLDQISTFGGGRRAS